MMDLHSIVFKCAHASLRRTIETFFFLLWHNTLKLSSYHSYPVLLLQRYQRLYFRGLATSFPQRAHSMPLNGFCSLPLSALHSSSCLWGLVLVLWFGSSGIETSSSYTSMLGSFQEDRWGYEEPDGTQWSG